MAGPIDSLLETPDAVTQLAVEFGPRLLSATLVLVAGLFVMRWVSGLATRPLHVGGYVSIAGARPNGAPGRLAPGARRA